MNSKDSFWLDYHISEQDLNSIYTHLLETEVPSSHIDLIKKLILTQIETNNALIETKRKSDGTVYFPKDQYSINQKVIFPHRSWEKGKVTAVREGINPSIPDLQVIDVEFSPGIVTSFASNLSEHKLNSPMPVLKEQWLDFDFVLDTYGEELTQKLKDKLDALEDLVCIAGNYFPRALLIDISVGHLNLCEAILEMENGGPLTTLDLLSQIDLQSGVNEKLVEFSLDLALQEDARFDEVGPAGKTLWFLNRLEPVEVRDVPMTLKFSGDLVTLPDELKQYQSFGTELCDELESEDNAPPVDMVTLSLTYPHWRAGTLPLTPKLKNLFPTAYETPRVKFDFFDSKNNSTFSGWVVRPSRYIFGLREWYVREGIIPGSLLQVSRSKVPGQVSIKVEKSKNSKEWIRTVLVGTDGGVVFALLKQVVSCSFDERMALVTPDIKSLDEIWEKKSRQPIEKTIQQIFHELVKLNPQGQIHAQELYSAVNVVRRCPPSLLLNVIFTQPWLKHLGDLYFKLTD
jgi:hypothetical protein